MRDWLVNIRNLKGFTQQEVAAHCGISRTTYASYEQHYRTPSARKAKVIGNFLGFDWTLFFEENGHETRRERRPA